MSRRNQSRLSTFTTAVAFALALFGLACTAAHEAPTTASTELADGTDAPCAAERQQGIACSVYEFEPMMITDAPCAAQRNQGFACSAYEFEPMMIAAPSQTPRAENEPTHAVHEFEPMLIVASAPTQTFASANAKQ